MLFSACLHIHLDMPGCSVPVRLKTSRFSWSSSSGCGLRFHGFGLHHQAGQCGWWHGRQGPQHARCGEWPARSEWPRRHEQWGQKEVDEVGWFEKHVKQTWPAASKSPFEGPKWSSNPFMNSSRWRTRYTEDRPNYRTLEIELARRKVSQGIDIYIYIYYIYIYI